MASVSDTRPEGRAEAHGVAGGSQAAVSEYFWNDTPSLLRVLIVCGFKTVHSPDADLSAASRLTESARRVVQRSGAMADVLDLSWTQSFWGEDNERKARVQERWLAAHGIVILAPVTWHVPSSPLKMMMDGFVGGDCDVVESPGRSYGIVVHGESDDAAASIPETSRQSLCEMLERLGMVPADDAVCSDRYTGYYEPSHVCEDVGNSDLQDAVRIVARSVVVAARKLHAARPRQPAWKGQC